MTQMQNYHSLQNAIRSFQIAESELSRPNEDAVTLCICQYSRNSVYEFLNAFLNHHSFKTELKMKPEELLKECVKLDSEFSAINLSCFACAHEGESCDRQYCLPVEKVIGCFETARSIKEIVISKLKIKDRDLH